MTPTWWRLRWRPYTAIAEAGGVEALVALATNGEADGQEEAARALRNLACNATNRAAVVERLVGLLSRGAARGKKAAAAPYR